MQTLWQTVIALISLRSPICVWPLTFCLPRPELLKVHSLRLLIFLKMAAWQHLSSRISDPLTPVFDCMSTFRIRPCGTIFLCVKSLYFFTSKHLLRSMCQGSGSTRPEAKSTPESSLPWVNSAQCNFQLAVQKGKLNTQEMISL